MKKLLPFILFTFLWITVVQSCRESDQAEPNHPPVAVAGEDQNVKTGEIVLLDAANSSDKEKDLLSFEWSIAEMPEGSNADIIHPDSVHARFIPDSAGTYKIKLLVSDQIDSSSDTLIISVEKGTGKPTAIAGNDKTVELGEDAILDGSNSFDPDGDALSFIWTFISTPFNSNAEIVDPDGAQTTFTPDISGTYLIKLTVSDGIYSADDTVVITVAGNQAPLANAGNNQNIDVGAIANLNGTGSSDPDGDQLTYLWFFESRPTGSNATIINPDQANPNFTADKPGKYVIILEVSDGSLTGTDRVEISTKSVSIANINPATGPAGTQVVIAGANFSPVVSENTVRFNGIQATVSSVTATSLTVTVPAASGTGTVTVMVNGVTATGPVFTYIPSATVTNFVALDQAVKIAVGANGNLYVSDYANHVIRQITLQGSVTTYAGTGQPGYNDGNSEVAMFNSPSGIAVDSDGNVYVADNGNHCIRKITPAGVVSTLSGFPQAGFSDYAGGPNDLPAQFNRPAGIAVDGAGNIYVADLGNNRIRKITQAGIVTTLAGDGNTTIFNSPVGIAIDAGNTLYVADFGNNRVRRVTQAGVVTTLAGNGEAGLVDGNGAFAVFNHPYGITCDKAGNVYVAEISNHTIRKITSQGTVTTIAGNGSPGNANGTGTNATFNQPTGLVTHPDNKIYVADFGNRTIRLITID